MLQKTNVDIPIPVLCSSFVLSFLFFSACRASAQTAAGPRGPMLEPRTARPAASATWPRACSFRHPICAHAPARVGTRRLMEVLASTERAWDVTTGALDLPAPDRSLDGAYDVYLLDEPESASLGTGAATFVADRDVRSRIDRASAFTLIDARTLPGCATDATVAREVIRASLLRSVPATNEGTARAESDYLARLVVPCAMPQADDVAVFQSHPDRALVDTWPESAPVVGAAFDRGASLFFWWLDYTYGTSPGGVVRGAWAVAPTMTPLFSPQWDDHPNAFDVLRESFKGALGTNSTVDDMYLDFAIARAFMGAADDGDHMPETRAMGDFARVHLDWDIPWPAVARRFQSPSGVSPLGAAYALVHREGAPEGSRLRVEAAWEEHARMRWAVVKLAADGSEIAQMAIPSLDRGTDAQMTMVELDKVAAVLVVGVSLGDPKWPFDPDDGVWEPHGWMLTVAAE
jgi:hypothetical protein